MADTKPATGILDDINILAGLTRPAWPVMLASLRRSGVPLMADEGDSGGDGDGDGGARGADKDGDDKASDDLGDPGKRALDAERTARRDAEKQLKDLRARLQSIEDKDKTDGEKLTVAEQRAQQAENRLAKVNAAIKKKLPVDLADRLIGDTPEELERDAERLSKQFAPSPGGGFDQGARGGGQPSDMDGLIRRAAGRT